MGSVSAKNSVPFLQALCTSKHSPNVTSSITSCITSLRTSWKSSYSKINFANKQKRSYLVIKIWKACNYIKKKVNIQNLKKVCLNNLITLKSQIYTFEVQKY